MIQNQLTLCISPVLKHSPRIMFCMWTSWWCHWLCWEWSEYYVMIGNVCLNTITITACVSILVVTRKSVCNIWKELSLSKCWCMFEEELTFDSFSLLVYRGERLIEPSRSWLAIEKRLSRGLRGWHVKAWSWNWSVLWRKVNDERNRGRVVFDIFTSLKWVRCSVQFNVFCDKWQL